jgi:hypothetical protein
MQDDDENIVFVDSISRAYTRNDTLGQNTPSSSSPTSPFRGRSPQECWSLLKQLCSETESIVHSHIFAVLDEESLRNDTLVLVEMDDDKAISARCEFKITCAKMNQYFIGDGDIEEDLEEASEEGNGVIRMR